MQGTIFNRESQLEKHLFNYTSHCSPIELNLKHSKKHTEKLNLITVIIATLP